MMVGLKDLKQADHMPVSDRRHQLHFGNNLLKLSWFERCLVHHLERDRLPGQLVRGKCNFAERSLTDQVVDLVAGKSRWEGPLFLLDVVVVGPYFDHDGVFALQLGGPDMFRCYSSFTLTQC